MRAGFLSGPPPKKKPAPAAPASKPVIEDVTHLKAQPKDERLQMPEVQEAMANNLTKNKD